MSLTATHDLTATRQSWHRVADHVLAAGQSASAGTIRLRPFPGGFATVRPLAGRHLAVVGTDLVVLAEDGRRRSTPLTTLGAAAAAADAQPALRGSSSRRCRARPAGLLRPRHRARPRRRPRPRPGGRPGAGRLVRPWRRRPP